MSGMGRLLTGVVLGALFAGWFLATGRAGQLPD